MSKVDYAVLKPTPEEFGKNNSENSNVVKIKVKLRSGDVEIKYVAHSQIPQADVDREVQAYIDDLRKADNATE